MVHREIEQRVAKVVCQVLEADPDAVRPESHFVYDLGAESTQWVALVTALEHEFGIEMDEDAALNLQTVGMVSDFIADKLS